MYVYWDQIGNFKFDISRCSRYKMLRANDILLYIIILAYCRTGVPDEGRLVSQDAQTEHHRR